jgi:hypothetical protein
LSFLIYIFIKIKSFIEHMENLVSNKVHEKQKFVE